MKVPRRSKKPPEEPTEPPPAEPPAEQQPSWKSLALPVLAGAVMTIAVLYLLVGREPSPSAPASAPPAAAPPEPASAPSASAALSASPALSAKASAAPRATAAPASPAPASGERQARAVWDAMGSRRPANATAGGSACALEATIATTAEGPLVLRALTVQCAGKPLHEVAPLPAGASASVEERPAIEPGTFAYVLRYRDDRAEIDTLAGRAIIDVTKPVIGAAWLAVANESRPTKLRLSPSTADEPALPGTAADRLTGHVTNVTGDTLVARDGACVLAFLPYGPSDGPGRCDVLVQCGPVTVLGAPEPFSAKCTRRAGKLVAAVDGEAEPADDDPGLFLDERTARLWNGGSGARWLVTLTLDSPRAPSSPP